MTVKCRTAIKKKHRSLTLICVQVQCLIVSHVHLHSYLFLLINQDHNGLFPICKILTHSKGTTCNCWTANQYKLCSLDLVEGLSIKSAGQSSGTSVRLSNLLSTVTPFMWITLNPGAIPPLYFSLKYTINSYEFLLLICVCVGG